jgi:undecaprenyl-diphosphatase
VVIAYGLYLTDHPGPTPTDTAASDVVDQIRAGWLTTVAKVTTFFGSTPAIAVVSVTTAAWLAYRRLWTELVILVVGVLAILVGSNVIKDIVDRPRPLGGLVDAKGSAYPSGHAAHAVIYAWIALTISRRTRAGVTRGAAIFAAGMVITVAIGLSRVYLGVHYLSDVSGGWALGVSVFALLVVVAVIVAYFRQDEADVI